jgi:hypothetical protein
MTRGVQLSAFSLQSSAVGGQPSALGLRPESRRLPLRLCLDSWLTPSALANTVPASFRESPGPNGVHRGGETAGAVQRKHWAERGARPDSRTRRLKPAPTTLRLPLNVIARRPTERHPIRSLPSSGHPPLAACRGRRGADRHALRRTRRGEGGPRTVPVSFRGSPGPHGVRRGGVSEVEGRRGNLLSGVGRLLRPFGGSRDNIPLPHGPVRLPLS